LHNTIFILVRLSVETFPPERCCVFILGDNNLSPHCCTFLAVL